MGEFCTPIKGAGRARTARNRAPKLRERICIACGRTENVRKDNPARKCLPCARSIALAALARGRATVQANVRRATCQHCGIIYKGINRRYCSWACKRNAHSVERTCETCGVVFRIARSIVFGQRNSVGRFCSRPCYVQWLCKPDRGQVRGSQWKRIRTEVLRRFPFCALCGTTKTLQVHHIQPYRRFGDNRAANLIPLCRKHHGLIDRLYRETEALCIDRQMDWVAWQVMLRERQQLTAYRVLSTWEQLQAQRGNSDSP